MSDPRLLSDPPDRQALLSELWPWLHDFYQQAQEAFQLQGLPSRRLEGWKYSRLDALYERRFVIPDDSPVLGDSPESLQENFPLAGHQLVFAGGRWLPEASRIGPLPEGARLCSMAQALSSERELLRYYLGQVVSLQEHPFAALNTLWLEDGLLLYLPSGCRLEQPIHCRFFNTLASNTPTGLRADGLAQVCFPRLLLVLEADAEATLIEEYLDNGEAESLTVGLTEIRLAEQAQLLHCQLQRGGQRSSHIAGLHVEQAAGSRLQQFSLTLGGAMLRNDLQVQLLGEGAETLLNGLYLLDGRQHLDNHLRIDHRVADCRSAVLYKGVLDDRAHGVFNGLAVVHPDAQRSDARQVNKNLLLSQGAEMDTKPELQIEADDVKCSHGATVGHLDSQALFYLQSRGLDADSARRLLTFAFGYETLQPLPDPLKGWCAMLLEQALQAQGATDDHA
ncbi:Fe-S cluster assembly protein SufD [Marinobacterium arenosum]|uniref:Fe-S cluster assembly protein SufD n=1 Tax=Marinobacterium arenosum TaxID=2862496 RepID=UPI001C977747|nr:Fe-S cluster assembly protein SufD [Marinobacterium arenosum]MBY4678863.1 Fe-S cluster assembly protein SufD [Marinobacterium arenosum]